MILSIYRHLVYGGSDGVRTVETDLLEYNIKFSQSFSKKFVVVELREKIRDTIAREVLEECKIEIEVIDVIEVIDGMIRDQKNI